MEKSTAIFIAFPGELEVLAKRDEKAKEILNNPDKFGSYPVYIQNIQKLGSRISKKKLDSSTFVILPEYVTSPSKIKDYCTQHNIPLNVRKLSWRKWGYCFASYRVVREYKEDGELYQFDWPNLKEEGIDTVLMAGERTIDNDGEQCVGVITTELSKQELNVKGIKGCLFPYKFENLQMRTKYDPDKKLIVDLLINKTVELKSIK